MSESSNAEIEARNDARIAVVDKHNHDVTPKEANNDCRILLEHIKELEATTQQVGSKCPNELCGGKLELICDYCGKEQP